MNLSREYKITKPRGFVLNITRKLKRLRGQGKTLQSIQKRSKIKSNFKIIIYNLYKLLEQLRASIEIVIGLETQ